MTILPHSTCALEFDDSRFSIISLKPSFNRTLYAAHAHDLANDSACRVLLRHLQDVVSEKLAAAKAAA